MCCILSAHPILIASFIFITNSSDDNTVESSSEITGTLQCVGFFFTVQEIWMDQVLSIKCRPHLKWCIAGPIHHPLTACAPHAERWYDGSNINDLNPGGASVVAL